MKVWRAPVAVVLIGSMMFIGTKPVWAAHGRDVRTARIAPVVTVPRDVAPVDDPATIVADEPAAAGTGAIEAPEENPWVDIMLIFGAWILTQSLGDIFEEVFEVGAWNAGFLIACVEAFSYVLHMEEANLAAQILDVLQQDPVYGPYGVNGGIIDGGGSVTVNTDTYATINLSLYFDGVPDSDFTGQEGGACWNDDNCTDPPEDMIMYCDNGGPDTLGTCVATVPHYCC